MNVLIIPFWFAKPYQLNYHRELYKRFGANRIDVLEYKPNEALSSKKIIVSCKRFLNEREEQCNYDIIHCISGGSNFCTAGIIPYLEENHFPKYIILDSGPILPLGYSVQKALAMNLKINQFFLFPLKYIWKFLFIIDKAMEKNIDALSKAKMNNTKILCLIGKNDKVIKLCDVKKYYGEFIEHYEVFPNGKHLNLHKSDQKLYESVLENFISSKM